MVDEKVESENLSSGLSSKLHKYDMAMPLHPWATLYSQTIENAAPEGDQSRPKYMEGFY